MDTFKKLNLIEKRKMAIEELVNYYAEYRIYCYNKGDKLKGIELRKKIHPLINLILKIDEVLSKEENIIVANENKAKEGVPKILNVVDMYGIVNAYENTEVYSWRFAIINYGNC